MASVAPVSLEQLELGRKVAQQRRRVGWSQPELADKLGQPVSWISRLERGLAPVPAAPVLRILPRTDPPAEPGRAAGPPDAADGSAAAAQALRQVLDDDRRYQPRADPIAVGSAADRGRLAARIWDLAVAGRHAELAALIGDVLPVLYATVRSAPVSEEAGLHQLAAACYQACSAVLAKLGDYAGAALAADKALAAAECAADPVAVAAGAYLLVCILLDADRYESAEAIAVAAADSLQSPAAGGSWTAISLRGALMLLSALAAVRGGDPARAEEFLSRARVLAGRVTYLAGEDAIGFSAEHVALFEIAISIESAAVPADESRAGR
jgi:transcriptional regulator with XRE-family HTH domain